MPRSVEYIKRRYATLTKLLEQEFPEEVDTENNSDTINESQTLTEKLNALRPNQKQTD
jgi:hypothetical protein